MERIKQLFIRCLVSTDQTSMTMTEAVTILIDDDRVFNAEIVVTPLNLEGWPGAKPDSLGQRPKFARVGPTKKGKERKPVTCTRCGTGGHIRRNKSCPGRTKNGGE